MTLIRHTLAMQMTIKKAGLLLGDRYTVTGGRSMHYVYQQLACCETCTTCKPFGLSAWIIVFAAAQLILTQVRLRVDYVPSHNQLLPPCSSKCCPLALPK